MSLNSILNIASSGLFTAQSGIDTVSRNVSNVNTEGYVRVEQQQEAVNINGAGAGVTVSALKLAANNFLEAASLNASSSSSAATVKSDYLDTVQSAFGDPTSDTSLFSQINSTLSSFETTFGTGNSTSARNSILSQLTSSLSQLSNVSSSIDKTLSQVNSDIGTSVDSINSILKDISDTNADITRGNIAGDSTGAQQKMSGLVSKLSEYMSVKVDYSSNGVAKVYTTDGSFLAGDGYSKLNYNAATSSGPNWNDITISYNGSNDTRSFEQSINGGKLGALLELRDTDIPQISDSLGEFSGKLADAINNVHNTNASLPALNSTTGTDTGLLSTDSLGFTGKTTIGVVDSTGALQRKIDVDFSAGTISVDGGTATAFTSTVGGFTTALNTALSGVGSASFSNGKLSMSATTSTNGLVFDEPSSGGSSRGDKAFASFFGLNNLISSTTPTSYATGLSSTDASGFTAGDNFTLQLNNSSGQTVTQKTITIPSGTIGDIVTAMNDSSTGLGAYGSFSLDSTGSLKWTANSSGSSLSMNMVDDSGTRGTSNLTMGTLFGLSNTARASRASSLSVNSSISADTNKLGLATVDLSSAATGKVVVGSADTNGAQAIANSLSAKMTFSANGKTSSTTVSDYMSEIANSVATMASNADSQATSAAALKTEADTRRSNAEGVNLDEELVKLTQYQQAYSAAARMIKAVSDMYDTLLNTVQ